MLELIDFPNKRVFATNPAAIFAEAKLVAPANYHRLGLQVRGELTVFSDTETLIGNLSIFSAAKSNVIYIGNRGAEPHSVKGAINFRADRCSVAFCGLGAGALNFGWLLLKRDGQRVIFGDGASAGTISHIDVEGENRGIFIGDECMMSSGVSFANHDMHTIFDIETGAVLNDPPSDIAIERHVWIGQDATILGCGSIGAGSIVGCGALVNKPVPPAVAVAGVPARIVRQNVTWSRPLHVLKRDQDLVKSLLEC